jgi:hypothetical protein
MFSSIKSKNKRVKQILPRNRVGGCGGKVAPTMYTHMNVKTIK